jgi:hypothetical protein
MKAAEGRWVACGTWITRIIQGPLCLRGSMRDEEGFLSRGHKDTEMNDLSPVCLGQDNGGSPGAESGQAMAGDRSGAGRKAGGRTVSARQSPGRPTAPPPPGKI